MLKKADHPVGVEVSLLQICVLLADNSQLPGFDRRLHVNARCLHPVDDHGGRIVVNDIKTLFTALQSDLHIGNYGGELFFLRLIDQAEMVVHAEFSYGACQVMHAAVRYVCHMLTASCVNFEFLRSIYRDSINQHGIFMSRPLHFPLFLVPLFSPSTPPSSAPCRQKVYSSFPVPCFSLL